jgi:hypothetical protein
LLNHILNIGNLLENFAILFFIILSFYYLFKTIIYDFICFAKAFNAMHNKNNNELMLDDSYSLLSRKLNIAVIIILVYLLY